MGMITDFLGTLRGFSGELRSCHDTIKRLEREVHDLRTAPMARSDLQALIERWFDGAAAEYEQMLREHVAGIVRKAERTNDRCQDMSSPVARMLAVVSVPANSNNPANPRTMDFALAALLGPQLKAAVLKAIDKLDWPAPEGLPWKAREAKLDQIEKQLLSLRAKKAEMLSAASANGLVIDLGD